ncbi:MAG TPA: choice-of-anchor D domain-containing protein [Methylomirabilota bacterium]|nr:choice-of-anchor D domain-containing protein [Methylomirabilota bacterium]
MLETCSPSSSGPRLNPGAIFIVALCFAFLLIGCASYTPQSNPTTPGALSLSASSFDFKTVVVGQTGTQTLTISNTGQSAVQLTGLSISNKQFAITGPAVPQTVAPAAVLSYKVTFTPTAAGNATATLTIASDAKTAVGAVSLSGAGEKAFANLVLNPVSVNFGNQKLNSTTTQNVTMQNTGDISMTIQGITVAGAGFGYSSISPGFSLAPNQQVTFQVWFTPKTAGAAAATVSFLSPSLSSAETLSLAGDGISSGGTNPPPPTPTAHTVHLTWNASSSQILGYRVYRSEVSGSSYSALNGTALTALTYDDSTVSNGTTYYYVVTAVDASGNESVYSNQTTAVIPAS